MGIGICPRCKQSFSFNDYDVDHVHTCNSGIERLDDEDLVRVNIPNMNLQGIPNRVQGTEAGVRGENIDTKNVFGHRESTHKTRQHYEYITLK